MMETKALQAKVDAALDKAEKTWAEHGKKLEKASAIEKHANFREGRTDAIAVPSNIPGHGIVLSDKSTVAWFVAWVVDLRDSSKHLTKIGKIEPLQRIYYETTALLTAAASLVISEAGGVTEYLGDGLLALFESEEPGKKQETAIYAAYRAARATLASRATVINPTLKKRYAIPEISFGIGMALSPALVTVVGVDTSLQAKAFGRCVWRASKLSGGQNEIKIDEWLEAAWPTKKGGHLRFTKRAQDGNLDFPFYVVSRDDE